MKTSSCKKGKGQMANGKNFITSGMGMPKEASLPND
jgi:hypothetical protein